MRTPTGRVAFYADIHYPTDACAYYWTPPPNRDVDAILLGGDIHYSPEHLHGMLKAIRATQRDDTRIIVVPGNSEYVGNELNDARARYRDAVERVDNATFLDNEIVNLPGGIRVIGSTLWCHVPIAERARYEALITQLNAQNPMVTRLGDRVLTLADMAELHLRARTYIEGELQGLSDVQRQTTIVCTHYWPTLEFARIEGYNRELLHCEGTDLDAIIASVGPKYWLCGHVHQTRRVVIGNTVVCSNPRAYDPTGINPEFAETFFVQLVS